MDADFSHDPADLPRLLAAARAAPTSCSARATCPAAASRAGRWTGRSSRAPAASTPGSCSARRSATSPAASSASAPTRCARSASTTSPPTATPSRSRPTFRAARAGLRIEEVPIVFRERRAGALQDVARHRRRGALAGPRDAARRPPPRGRTGARDDARCPTEMDYRAFRLLNGLAGHSLGRRCSSCSPLTSPSSWSSLVALVFLRSPGARPAGAALGRAARDGRRGAWRCSSASRSLTPSRGCGPTPLTQGTRTC